MGNSSKTIADQNSEASYLFSINCDQKIKVNKTRKIFTSDDDTLDNSC